MIKTFDYFLNTKDCTLDYIADECRSVKRWAWYSYNDHGKVSTFNPYANLFSPEFFQITSTGMRFRATHYHLPSDRNARLPAGGAILTRWARRPGASAAPTCAADASGCCDAYGFCRIPLLAG